MNTFVFLGPSLPLAQAQAIFPEAHYLPPVAMGDLYALVQARARAGDRIAMIDGLFEQVPAVWHKEVLFALERGMHVYGASSMGALRAAELAPFGMKGVGRIYSAFASGELEDDDEVVVAHATAEQGFRSLSQAMVSLRFGLQALQMQGVLGAADAATLIAMSKALHYSERSWVGVLDHARRLGLPEQLVEALKNQARQPDAKALDATELLRQLAAADTPEPPFQADFTLERNAFWQALEHSQAARLQQHSSQSGEQDVLAHVRALHPRRRDVRQYALLMRMAAELGRDLHIEPAQLQAAARRLAQELGLSDRQALVRWREQHSVDERLWLQLLDLEARIEALQQAYGTQLDGFERLVIKRQGIYADAAATVEKSRKLLDQRGIVKPTLADAAVDADTLQAWYEAKLGPLRQTPESHAQALGFESMRDWIGELIRAQMLEQAETVD
ncbi:TfuA-like protein [Paucibacter sp. APW11]|uniref:TfuA-like protein n=1 Tax=Roseateles aquae TaxID=3077235 RepID=A0ABU3PBB3_9BURK|nr:TfuA-like protein [Paucibacter sp. APW11]MDT8999864.1 TfuA-like protein [Paucibacter sp. APW11]